VVKPPINDSKRNFSGQNYRNDFSVWNLNGKFPAASPKMTTRLQLCVLRRQIGKPFGGPKSALPDIQRFFWAAKNTHYETNKIFIA